MNCKRECILVLVLHTLCAVMARPSETAESSSPHDTLTTRCLTTRPQVLATTAQIVGDWCRMESTVVGDIENTTGAHQACTRYAYSYDGEHLRVVLTIAHEGKLHVSNQTFSRFDSESWRTSGPRPNIFYFGYVEEGPYLLTRVCRAHGSDTQQVDDVYEIAVARCLRPGERSPASRPHIVGCNIPAVETAA